MPFDRTIYFDAVRSSLFAGKLSQQQVDGQNAILSQWELHPISSDLRHLAYPLATTIHETASTMWPIEEYGKGSGQPYGKPDPETGQTYYGRGFVQLTWRDNYAKADRELGLKGDNSCEWHATNALNLNIAADVMFYGMDEGWFRKDSKGPQTLDRYFSNTVNDAFGAREIINGDKNIVPSWSKGVNIGNLIKGYHEKFLSALDKSWYEEVVPVPPPVPEKAATVDIVVNGNVVITVNGKVVYMPTNEEIEVATVEKVEAALNIVPMKANLFGNIGHSIVQSLIKIILQSVKEMIDQALKQQDATTKQTAGGIPRQLGRDPGGNPGGVG